MCLSNAKKLKYLRPLFDVHKIIDIKNKTCGKIFQKREIFINCIHFHHVRIQLGTKRHHKKDEDLNV